jgi:outer membrane biogenesis lipoprotein LolB
MGKFLTLLRSISMRIFITIAVAILLSACAASAGPKYLNRDGNAATWGEGKREINTSLADVQGKDDL